LPSSETGRAAALAPHRLVAHNRVLLHRPGSRRRIRGVLLGAVLVSCAPAACSDSAWGSGCDSRPVPSRPAVCEPRGPDCDCPCGIRRVPLDGSHCPSDDIREGTCVCPLHNVPLEPVHGIRADGRIDITALEAWPDRPAPRSPLSADDVARGCAILAACIDSTIPPFLLLHLCSSRSSMPAFPDSREWVQPVRGPTGPSYNETWNFLIRLALAAHGDCASLRTPLTEDSDLWCSQAGCWATTESETTCNGDVATVGTLTRDCSRSETHCSAHSVTGCTDRQLLPCDSEAKSRCDGDVRLGCSGCGFVTYNDCAWAGRHCVENPAGAECAPPPIATTPCGRNQCIGNLLEVCVDDLETVVVDCASLDMHCVDATYCAPNSSDAGEVVDSGSRDH
jgi:hypothetical protein